MDRLLAARAPGKTVCPSDVARALAPEGWRPLMPLVRDVARSRALAGTIVVMQRGLVVDIDDARGPIRLARPEPPAGLTLRRRNARHR